MAGKIATKEYFEELRVVAKVAKFIVEVAWCQRQCCNDGLAFTYLMHLSTLRGRVSNCRRGSGGFVGVYFFVYKRIQVINAVSGTRNVFLERKLCVC